MSDYEQLAGLDVRVTGYETERRRVEVSTAFARVTTIVLLHGAGDTGLGEDVTYLPPQHDLFPTDLPLEGEWKLDELSRALDAHDLPDYRRWAFESAALDLALRQARLSLGDAVGREYRPVRFVVSTREEIHRWRELYPSLEFKVDPTSDWTRALMEELASTGRVRCADLKGYYVGTPVDQPPDPRLYRDVVEVFADAIIEDAVFTAETREILRAAEDRLSFDAPVHSVGDLATLEVEPRWLNVKPSRFGTCRRLFETLAYCEERGIRMYGGGQFELGPGRAQIQALASLYYPDSPNDIAPTAYNLEPRPGLPSSPLQPPQRPRGLSLDGLAARP